MRDFHVFMEKYRKGPYAVAYKKCKLDEKGIISFSRTIHV